MEPQVTDFNGMLGGVQSRRVDIPIGGIAWSKARQEEGLFTDPAYYSPPAMAVHGSEKYSTIADLEGKDLGTVTGYVWVKAIQALPGATLHAGLLPAGFHLRVIGNRRRNRVGQLSSEPVDDVVHFSSSRAAGAGCQRLPTNADSREDESKEQGPRVKHLRGSCTTNRALVHGDARRRPALHRPDAAIPTPRVAAAPPPDPRRTTLQGRDSCPILACPGEFPFTRGIQPTMYRGRLWTMRQYAGLRHGRGVQRAATDICSRRASPG